MKDLFSEYYPPTDDEFATLWEKATVVLDASVLLALYEYSASTLNETMEVLQQLADSNRLWLPYQAALEYQRGRPGVIASQETEQYDTAYSALTKLKKMADDLDEKLGQHAYLDPDETVDVLRNAAADFENHLKAAKNTHPNIRQNDPIRERLDTLYEGRVGKSWSDDKLTDVSKQGKNRYDYEVPPGYADKDKPAHLRYGDLVFWLQVLEYAASESPHIIVVTNDSKADWWTKPRGKLFGPRPELRGEFRDVADGLFYMYSHDRFMKWAAEYLNIGVEQESIDEIRDVLDSKAASVRLAEAIGRLQGTAFPNLSTTLNLPDYSESFGKLTFPDFPNLTATLNLPDYSESFGDTRLFPEPTPLPCESEDQASSDRTTLSDDDTKEAEQDEESGDAEPQ